MDNTAKAILLMCISLPTMFVVIGLFITLTRMLHKAFPAED